MPRHAPLRAALVGAVSGFILASAGPAHASGVFARIFEGSQILDVAVDTSVGLVRGPIRDSISRMEGVNALGTGHMHADYDVQMGRIRANASMDVNAGGGMLFTTNIDSGVTTTGAWQDVLTFQATGLAGTTGHFRPRIRISGSYDAHASGLDLPYASQGSGAYLVTLMVSTPLVGRTQQRYGSCIADAYLGGGCSPLGDLPGTWILDPVPFVFGTPFTLDVSGDVSAAVRAVKNGSGDAFAHLGNTIEWDGIVDVTDADGHPITAFTLGAQSEFDYTTSSVPEPSTSALLGWAFAVLGALRHRGRVS